MSLNNSEIYYFHASLFVKILNNDYFVILFFFLFFERFLLFGVCACQKDREAESEKSLPRGDGHAAIPSPPFSFQDLGHTCTRAWCEFKPPGLGLTMVNYMGDQRHSHYANC